MLFSSQSTKLAFILLLALITSVMAQPENDGLEALKQRAVETHSDAFLLWKDGELLLEHYSTDGPKKIHAMSCTKSVVSMAIGRLLEEGKIGGLDQPICDFYPEWKQGRKRHITLRHLMNHTSGMQNLPNTREEIYPSPDFVQLALAAEIDHDPGTHFAYNNKAVNLLSGVVEKASGQRMDQYIREKLFEPLAIQDADWDLDDSDHAQGMAGLHILPRDLLKLGRLMFEGGDWEGQVLLEPDWVAVSTREHRKTGCGLLWWVAFEGKEFVIDEASVSAFQEHTNSPELHRAAQSVIGVYKDQASLREVVGKAFEACWEIGENFGPLLDRHLIRVQKQGRRGYYASGYLGQYLLILPEERVVAVRMISWSKDYNKETDGFEDFIPQILKFIDKTSL